MISDVRHGADPGRSTGLRAGVTQIPGVLTLFGGTITNVSGYTYSTGSGFTGDKSASLTITFTADVSDPVLAWGGHIATRQDWGQNNSAVGITGSPYHTRIIEVNGSGGNQDRSLKRTRSSSRLDHDHQGSPGTDPQNFSFTASGGLLPASFELDDTGLAAPPATGFSGIEVFGDYVFTETLPAGCS